MVMPADTTTDQNMETQQIQQTQSQPRRRAPGLLRLLPETLPFYPYKDSCHKKERQIRTKSRQQKIIDVGNVEDSADSDERKMNPNEPLHMIDASGSSEGFTLFFFVDSTNRQSLHAVPAVSSWFQRALVDGENKSAGNRVICIPNHPAPREISLHDSTSDPIMQASINASVVPVAKQQILSMMLGTGFYHLPFLHPKRLPLLHLLGATRVPSIIVVSNASGRIVTRYGWEAIEREGSILDQWIQRNWIENKKCDGDEASQGSSSSHFDSEVVKDWFNGKSGLPFWWYLLSWIL